ncbi:MAG: peptidylprolyl isomerase [Bryobacteraceae bacterium]
MFARFLVSTTVFAFGLMAQPPVPAPKPALKPAMPKPVAPAPAKPAREPGLYCTLSITHGVTPLGNITFKFYEKESPITVKNFVDLAQGRKEWLNPRTGTRVKAPLFTGLTFHRVIPEFMIQGGDPQGNGMGGTDPIPDEYHPSLRFDIPGRVAMANAGAGTGSSQFFITEGTPGSLNGKHTIFGQVIEGQELVAKIARLPRNRGDKPDVPVKMSRVLITRVADPNAPKPVAPAMKKKAAPAVKKAAPAAAPAPSKKG